MADPRVDRGQCIFIVRQIFEPEENGASIGPIEADLHPSMRVVVDDAVHVDLPRLIVDGDDVAVQPLQKLLGGHAGADSRHLSVRRAGSNVPAEGP